MARQWSRIGAIHRALKLDSRDPVKGEDARRFQSALNRRAAALGLGTVHADGVIGPATKALSEDVGLALGALPSTVRKPDITVGLQRIVRHPGTRTPAQRKRAKAWTRPAPAPAGDRLSQKGADFIGAFEGFRSAPYRDAVGVWTIGYGSTGGVGPNTPPVTRAQAAARLIRECDETYTPAVLHAARAGGHTLKQHELDALVSASYNLGPGVFAAGRTLGNALRSGSTAWRALVGDALLLYDKAGGRTLAGLTRRRRAERRLFLTGNYSTE